jgi:hypothetical protein
MVATLTRIFGVLADGNGQKLCARRLRRERTARTFARELGRLLQSEWTLAPAV